MKRFLCVFLLAFGPGIVRAQIPVATDPPLVNQFIENSLEQRSRAWWRALGSQLALTLDRPVDQVAEVSLQNVIYFANNHADRVDLSDAAPLLMEIYRKHELVGFRIMALSALHAIGDEAFLEQAYRLARQSDSERVRRMARAALADAYRHNP